MSASPVHSLTSPRLIEREREESSVAPRPRAMFRNGHALILSSIATSGIGFLFWIVAARLYPVAVVGRDTAALSAMTFIGGVAQFNLAGALVRFIPVAGRHTLRFVLGTYAICLTAATLISLGFLAVLPHVAPSLEFLRSDQTFIIWWAIATATWAMFVLEDGVLTGLRLARWVPVENAGFSIAKIALVIPFATIAPKSGIYLAWTVATAATVVPTSVFLFARGLPRNPGRFDEGSVSVAELARYVPYDSLASFCWLAATSLTPLLVIHEVGASKSALFSLDWTTTYVLYLFSINMGASMVVEAAAHKELLREHCSRVRWHLAKLVTPAVAALVLGAPIILRLFGSAYAAGGAPTLRILALSALPFIITSTAICALRVRRETRSVFYMNVAICVLVLALARVLVPIYGVRGAALAWLVAQSFVAVLIIVFGDAWITGSRREHLIERAVTLELRIARLMVKLGVPSFSHPLRKRLERRRAARQFAPDIKEFARTYAVEGRLELDLAPSASDLAVFLLRRKGEAPFVALKFARTDQARADLEAQSAIVANLASDPRLRGWSTLVPRVQLVEGGRGLYAIESASRGEDAAQRLRATPEQWELIARNGLEMIARLHRSSAQIGELTSDDFENLIERPLRTLVLAHPSGYAPDSQGRALEQIRDRLYRVVADQAIELTWTHGDFSPGNVLMEGPDCETISVIDWGQASPRGIPAIDVVSWLATIAATVSRRQLGQVLCELLEQDDLSKITVCSLAADEIDRSGLDHRDVALWFWLHHIAGNLEKSQRYARHPLWWASNVEPVLRAVLQ